MGLIGKNCVQNRLNHLLFLWWRKVILIRTNKSPFKIKSRLNLLKKTHFYSENLSFKNFSMDITILVKSPLQKSHISWNKEIKSQPIKKELFQLIESHPIKKNKWNWRTLSLRKNWAIMRPTTRRRSNYSLNLKSTISI